MMRRLGALLFTVVCGFGAVIACSSADSKPPAATSNSDAAGGGGEGGAVDSGDASKDYPASCRDTMKDNTETDTDCGGGTCAPCKIGQTCASPSDCEDTGATCDNKICALCHDGMTNGSETDVDCGGAACGTCKIGKHCKAGSDCASNTCNSAGQCDCPTDMAIVALGGDQGAFCIDKTEVTNGQYFAFVTANVNISTQTGSCLTSNGSFVPPHAWPPHTAPVVNGVNSLPFNMGLPVHYVDWCDAYAYCGWAKKRLCGTLEGKPLSPGDANDSTKSAWYNACTAQGQHAFPYGPTFDASLCNGTGGGGEGPDPAITKDIVSAHYGVTSNEDHGIYEIVTADMDGKISGIEHALCQGGSVSLYQMSGNVAEWEDDCEGTAANSNCKLRGGSYTANNDSTALACAASRSLARMPTDVTSLADVGIRCCAY